MLCRYGPFGFGRKGCGEVVWTLVAAVVSCQSLISTSLTKITPRKQVFRIDDLGHLITCYTLHGHLRCFPIKYRTILRRLMDIGADSLGRSIRLKPERLFPSKLQSEMPVWRP